MELPEIPYEVSFRNIKFPRLEFSTGKLLLILPFGYSPEVIVEKYKNWIMKKLGFINECLKESYQKELYQRKKDEIDEILNKLIKDASDDLGVRINGIFWRNMKTKWASISSKKNLTLNTKIQKLPIFLIKYIIYHELAHLLEKKHNENFWKIIQRKFQNYKELEKELFIYWFAIQKEK